VALVAAAFVLSLAACGSDGDTTAPTVTVPTADVRLSTESWALYVEARDQAQEVNQAARKTFAACDARTLTAENKDAVKTCLSGATEKVVAEGEDFRTVLDGFTGEAGGACAKALTNLDGYVKLYIASVQGIASAVERGSSSGVQTQIGQSNEALEAARAATVAFDAACAPA
jgi:hypothetical protein